MYMKVTVAGQSEKIPRTPTFKKGGGTKLNSRKEAYIRVPYIFISVYIYTYIHINSYTDVNIY